MFNIHAVFVRKRELLLPFDQVIERLGGSRLSYRLHYRQAEYHCQIIFRLVLEQVRDRRVATRKQPPGVVAVKCFAGVCEGRRSQPSSLFGGRLIVITNGAIFPRMPIIPSPFTRGFNSAA